MGPDGAKLKVFLVIPQLQWSDSFGQMRVGGNFLERHVLSAQMTKSHIK